MLSTRVGYTGGGKLDPTYYDLGDHTESVQVDYDPNVISYDELLDIFWSAHSPTAAPYSRQYRSAVFYHSEAQQQLAVASKAELQSATGREIYTAIEPANTFYLAEDYHQKYYLQADPALMDALAVLYPVFPDLVSSTAAARLNGRLGGHGSITALEAELSRSGLSPDTAKQLAEVAER